MDQKNPINLENSDRLKKVPIDPTNSDRHNKKKSIDPKKIPSDKKQPRNIPINLKKILIDQK